MYFINEYLVIGVRKQVWQQVKDITEVCVCVCLCMRACDDYDYDDQSTVVLDRLANRYIIACRYVKYSN